MSCLFSLLQHAFNLKKLVSKDKVRFCLLSLLLLFFIASCSKQAPPRQMPRFPVNTATVEQKDTPLFVESIGNVYSPNVVQVRPQVGGVLLEVHVKEGDLVKKGDLLYTIDPAPYQASLDRAKATLTKDMAQLEQALNRVERYTNLAKKDYVSKLSYEEYISQAKALQGQILIDQAEIDLAQINLNFTTIFSPIDGKISQYNIYPGNVVVANDTNALTEIRQVNPLEVRFTLSQSQFQQVKESQRITGQDLKFLINLPENPDRYREGDIFFFDNQINQATGTIVVKGRFENEDLAFWPGEFVRVRLLLTTLKDALLVPEQAVQTGQQGPFTFVIDPAKMTAELRLVKTGEKIDNKIVVTEGLKPGEIVVTEGQLNLKNGFPVSIKSQDGAAPPQAASQPKTGN